MRLALVLVLSSCAALKTGWARVTYVEGRISPALECTSKIATDGEVELLCRGLNNVETDLLWKREQKRSTNGDT